MLDLGTVLPGSTVYIPFHTFDSNDPSASVTITGFAVTDIEVYKDGSATQRASDAGYTLLDTDGIDFDTITGLHGFSIDLSDNTTANFWEAGSVYMVAVSSITVDAATVNFWSARFRIGYPGALLDTTIATLSSQTSFTLEDGSADNDAYNGFVAYVHDLASAVQVAIGYVSDYVGSTKTVTLAADPGIFTMAAGDNISLFPPANVAAWLGNAVTASSGNPDVNVESMDADVITATVIAADAIGASEIAADAIGSSELATTAVDEIVDAVWDEVLTGGTHNVANSAGRRLRFLQEAGTYAGAIWIDTVNGTAGTTDFENGTDSNPVDNIADANTLAASLGISRFMVAPGSSITFAATQTDQEFMGRDWTLNLGTQNISGSFIEGASVAASTFTAATGAPIFYQCIFDNAVTMAPCVLRESYIGNTTLTMGSAGDFFFNFCMSRVAGTGTPTIDFGAALNASNVSMRHYSGGIEIQNMGAGTGTYNMSLEGQGNLIINANCSATSNVAIRGAFTLTNNASGITITDDARLDMLQINGEVDTALSDIGLDHLLSAAVVGADVTDNSVVAYLASSSATADWDSYVNTTDSLQAIADSGGGGPTAAQIADAVWDETATDHTAAGSFGEDIFDIVADTNELQTDWANGGRLDLILDARASQTTADAIETDTQDIQSRLPAALVSGKMDSDMTAISGDTTAADNLEEGATGLVPLTVNDAGATTTVFITSSTEATDDHYNGRIITFTSGALAGQSTDITDYNGTTKAVTVTALTEAPANSVSFVIS